MFFCFFFSLLFFCFLFYNKLFSFVCFFLCLILDNFRLNIAFFLLISKQIFFKILFFWTERPVLTQYCKQIIIWINFFFKIFTSFFPWDFVGESFANLFSCAKFQKVEKGLEYSSMFNHMKLAEISKLILPQFWN